MPRSRSLPMQSVRRALIPGGSEHLNRFRILKRRQNRHSRSNTRVHRNHDEDSSNSDHYLEIDPDEEIQKVVNLVRNLTEELHLPLKEKHPINLAFSPVGFCISAVMLKFGCSGIASKELGRALFPKKATGGGDASDELCSEIAIGLNAVLAEINARSRKYFKLKHGNKLYSQSKIKHAYKNQVKTIFAGVELEELDLNTSWSQATSVINKWAHNTGGKMLGDMLTKRTLNNRLICVNPVYFEGNWVHPFKQELTEDMKFFTSESDFINVPMMKSAVLKNLLYAPINKLACRALVLPYKGDRLCLVIFIPNEKTALSTIETGLEHISPTDYFKSMSEFRKKLGSQSGIQVYLPKFQIDCTIDYEGPMKEMGIESVFKSAKANFTPMIDDPSASTDFSVTQILQKVKISINELGFGRPPRPGTNQSENSSGALVNAKPGSSGSDLSHPSPEIIEFCVNRPFYFQVVDMKSDLILIAGSCTNPLHGKDLGFEQYLQKYDIHVPQKASKAPENTKT